MMTAWLRPLVAVAVATLALGGCRTGPGEAAGPGGAGRSAAGTPAPAQPSLAPGPPESAATVAPCPTLPGVVAHRGGMERAIENTVNAFRSAGRAGIDEWELDVRFDVRGTPVLLHDATVDRISPMSGPIARLDARNGAIPTDDGQYIPTLREVYDEASAYRAQVLTELKVMPTAEQWAEVARHIDDTIGRSAVTLMSFDRAVVLKAQQEIPGTTTGLVQNAGNVTAAHVKRYGLSFIKGHRSINARNAADWDAAGLRLYAWTVDQSSDWARLSTLPIDAVITNQPIRYRSWAARQCRAALTPSVR